MLTSLNLFSDVPNPLLRVTNPSTNASTMTSLSPSNYDITNPSNYDPSTMTSLTPLTMKLLTTATAWYNEHFYLQ